MEQGFLKLERPVGVKFGETTDVLCVVNSTHHAEINYIELIFLMQLQLKQLWEDPIIKLWNTNSDKERIIKVTEEE